MLGRMKREFQLLESDPPHGVGAWAKGDSLTVLEAQLTGPRDTPYEGGTFLLEVIVPDRYPFEPPKIRFLTPVYHPNIDSGGRICLDTLKMPPRGSWKPSLNIVTTLATIRLLLANANADDGLMPEVTQLYKSNRRLFDKTARDWTAQHAMGGSARSSSSSSSLSSPSGPPPPQSSGPKRPMSAGADGGRLSKKPRGVEPPSAAAKGSGDASAEKAESAQQVVPVMADREEERQEEAEESEEEESEESEESEEEEEA